MTPSRLMTPEDFYLSPHPELGFLVTAALGFPATLYRLEPGELFREVRYQVIYEGPSGGPGSAFWRWHSSTCLNPYFVTPADACAAFVLSYHRWCAIAGARPVSAPRNKAGRIDWADAA